MNGCPIQFVCAPEEFDRSFAGAVVWIVPLRDLDDAAARAAEVRRVIGLHLNMPVEEVSIVKDIHGRPQLADESLGAVDFSVASAAGVLVVGVAPNGGRIGVDVELMSEVLTPLPLTREHFTAGEQARISALAPAERLVAFYEAWTAKEAMAKAIGHGFSFGLNGIETDVQATPLDPLRIVRITGSERLAAGWRVFHHRIGKLIVCAAVG